VIGTKEVIDGMKGSKLVICSSSLPSNLKDMIKNVASKNNATLVELSKNSSELGRMIGRPFRISAISLRSVSDSDLKQLAS
jgi:large subunit ribosomal protein L30e